MQPKTYHTIENPNSSDLADLQNLNGNGTLDFDGIWPNTDMYPNSNLYPNQDGQFLKGALDPRKLRGDIYTVNDNLYQNHEKRLDNNVYNDNFQEGQFVGYWFWIIFQQFFQASIELLKYENAPFDTYALEYQLKYNGICGIIKIEQDYKIVAVEWNNPTQSNFNFAYLPKEVTIKKEDTLYKYLKDIKMIVGKNIVLVRNNLFQSNAYINCRRYLWNLEKLLFYFEKNNAVSLPKALLIADLKKSAELLKNWRKFANSSEVLNLFWTNSDMLNVLRANGFKSPWIPMDFADKTQQLVENFNFIFERLKETFGLDTMNLNGKKERVTTQEVNVSNSMASYNLNHMLNIRKHDLLEFKKVFGVDVTIKKAEIDNPLLEKKRIDDKKGRDDVI